MIREFIVSALSCVVYVFEFTSVAVDIFYFHISK